MYEWFVSVIQFLIVLPAGASCYLPAVHQMKYPALRTAVLCLAVLVPYSLLAAWLAVTFGIAENTLLLPSMAPFFFLFRRTVHTDLPRSLAIFVGVCAVQTFPFHFTFFLKTRFQPLAGSAVFAMEGTLLHLFLACLMPVLFAWPAIHWFSWAVDRLDIPRVWYSTVALSSICLFFNTAVVPFSYELLENGRLHYFFPLMEVCTLLVLVMVYDLFYQGAVLILDRDRLLEDEKLLKKQIIRYRNLQDCTKHTARLRHDFRHHIRLLAELARKGDLEGIRSYLAEYEDNRHQPADVHFCSNTALDALLGYYHAMALHAGVETSWVIRLPEPLPFSEPDLAVLFGNLCENAIYSCQTLPEGCRHFSLTAEVSPEKNFVIMSANSFDGKIQKDSQGYRSTRHSGKGAGLGSITSVAEKYKGSASFSNNNSSFSAKVVLNIMP